MGDCHLFLKCSTLYPQDGLQLSRVRKISSSILDWSTLDKNLVGPLFSNFLEQVRFRLGQEDIDALLGALRASYPA